MYITDATASDVVAVVNKPSQHRLIPPTPPSQPSLPLVLSPSSPQQNHPFTYDDDDVSEIQRQEEEEGSDASEVMSSLSLSEDSFDEEPYDTQLCLQPPHIRWGCYLYHGTDHPPGDAFWATVSSVLRSCEPYDASWPISDAVFTPLMRTSTWRWWQQQQQQHWGWHAHLCALHVAQRVLCPATVEAITRFLVITVVHPLTTHSDTSPLLGCLASPLAALWLPVFAQGLATLSAVLSLLTSDDSDVPHPDAPPCPVLSTARDIACSVEVVEFLIRTLDWCLETRKSAAFVSKCASIEAHLGFYLEHEFNVSVAAMLCELQVSVVSCLTHLTRHPRRVLQHTFVDVFSNGTEQALLAERCLVEIVASELLLAEQSEGSSIDATFVNTFSREVFFYQAPPNSLYYFDPGASDDYTLSVARLVESLVRDVPDVVFSASSIAALRLGLLQGLFRGHHHYPLEVSCVAASAVFHASAALAKQETWGHGCCAEGSIMDEFWSACFSVCIEAKEGDEEQQEDENESTASVGSTLSSKTSSTVTSSNSSSTTTASVIGGGDTTNAASTVLMATNPITVMMAGTLDNLVDESNDNNIAPWSSLICDNTLSTAEQQQQPSMLQNTLDTMLSTIMMTSMWNQQQQQQHGDVNSSSEAADKEQHQQEEEAEEEAPEVDNHQDSDDNDDDSVSEISTSPAPLPPAIRVLLFALAHVSFVEFWSWRRIARSAATLLCAGAVVEKDRQDDVDTSTLHPLSRELYDRVGCRLLAPGATPRGYYRLVWTTAMHCGLPFFGCRSAARWSLFSTFGDLSDVQTVHSDVCDRVGAALEDVWENVFVEEEEPESDEEQEIVNEEDTEQEDIEMREVVATKPDEGDYPDARVNNNVLSARRWSGDDDHDDGSSSSRQSSIAVFG
eukprot:PhM_4_TR17030/c0_g1_i1/m.94619